jgi:putative phosphoribosyl transferase
LEVTYLSREDAGRRLGQYLVEKNVRPDFVLGLPRGGVIVAAQVAGLLQCALGALAVRKIGHPKHREYAVGALAEGGVVRLDEAALAESNIVAGDLQKIIAEETKRLQAAEAMFHATGKFELRDKVVLIVDDGLATGATAEAAVMSARNQKARQVLVAVPVTSINAGERMAAVADGFHALVTDPNFAAVGQYYDSFPQVSDEAVMALLA